MSVFPMIEEADADAALAEIYDEVKRTTQTPFVPNMSKTVLFREHYTAHARDLHHSLYDC